MYIHCRSEKKLFDKCISKNRFLEIHPLSPRSLFEYQMTNSSERRVKVKSRDNDGINEIKTIRNRRSYTKRLCIEKIIIYKNRCKLGYRVVVNSG